MKSVFQRVRETLVSLIAFHRAEESVHRRGAREGPSRWMDGQGRDYREERPTYSAWRKYRGIGLYRTIALMVAAVLVCVGVGLSSAHAKPDPSNVRERASESTSLVFHYPSEYKPLVEKFDAESGRIVGDLKRELGLEHVPAVDVWVLPEVSHYFELTERPGGAPEWAIGLSLGDERTVVVARDTQLPGTVQSDLQKTFIHELAHVAIDIARNGAHVPRWFNEGFALSQAREWSPERRQQLTRAASTGALIPFEDLNRNFPAHHNVASLAYAQSFHFVRYLQEHHGNDVTARIMERLREGAQFPEAVERATGRPLATLQIEWRQKITSETSWLSLLQDDFAIFFGAAVLFFILWVVRRKQLRSRADGAADESTDWDYDKSRYPLPGDVERS